MQAEAAHQGPVGEEKHPARRRAGARPGREVRSAARSPRPRTSRSPSRPRRPRPEHGGEELGLGQRALELDAVVDHDLRHRHHAIRWAISGNSVASMHSARTRVDATAMCCARRTARGQWGQVGVVNTLIVTSSARSPSAAWVAALTAGSPGGGHDDRVDQVGELVAARGYRGSGCRSPIAPSTTMAGVTSIAVAFGALALDERVEHLHRDLVGERRDLPHQGHRLLVASRRPARRRRRRSSPAPVSFSNSCRTACSSAAERNAMRGVYQGLARGRR